MNSKIKNELFSIFGEMKEICSYSDSIKFHSEKFVVQAIKYSEKYPWVISANVFGFCHKDDVIHFNLSKPLSRRKMRRIHDALNFLLRNKKSWGSYYGEIPGFDDLGRRAAWNYKKEI